MWSVIEPLFGPDLLDALLQVVDGEDPGLDGGHVVVLQIDHLKMLVWRGEEGQLGKPSQEKSALMRTLSKSGFPYPVGVLYDGRGITGKEILDSILKENTLFIEGSYTNGKMLLIEGSSTNLPHLPCSLS